MDFGDQDRFDQNKQIFFISVYVYRYNKNIYM